MAPFPTELSMCKGLRQCSLLLYYQFSNMSAKVAYAYPENYTAKPFLNMKKSNFFIALAGLLSRFETF